MIETISFLIKILTLHAIFDYPLQGSFLATCKDPKNKMPLPYYHLGVHVWIHAGALFWMTGSFLFFFLELIIHGALDLAKVKEKTTLLQDQLGHIASKFLYAAIYYFYFVGA